MVIGPPLTDDRRGGDAVLQQQREFFDMLVAHIRRTYVNTSVTQAAINKVRAIGDMDASMAKSSMILFAMAYEPTLQDSLSDAQMSALALTINRFLTFGKPNDFVLNTILIFDMFEHELPAVPSGCLVKM